MLLVIWNAQLFFFLHSWMRNYQHIVCIFLHVCINKICKVRVLSWRIYVYAVGKNIHLIHHGLMPSGNLDPKDNHTCSKQGSHYIQRAGHNFYFSGFKINMIWHSSRKLTRPKGLYQAKGIWGACTSWNDLHSTLAEKGSCNVDSKISTAQWQENIVKN